MRPSPPRCTGTRPRSSAPGGASSRAGSSGRSATLRRGRGRERALSDKPRPGGRPKLDGKGEAHLVALACSAPPEGRARWTMQLLADRLVELALVGAIGDETVRRTLKKTR
jgi:hypothetical protein